MIERKSHSILVAAVLFLAFVAAAHAGTTGAAAPSNPTAVVNINTADSLQLSYLPHVGPKAAQRIIDYRHEHGPFKKTSDLMQVKGIGEKTFNRLAPFISVDGKTTLAAKIQGSRKAGTSKAAKARGASGTAS